MNNKLWIEHAVEGIRQASNRSSGKFTIEELRVQIDVPTPTDLRMWGHATRIAKQRGYIVNTGEMRPAVSSNMSPKPLYSNGKSAIQKFFEKILG